jgi:hypothetical protein
VPDAASTWIALDERYQASSALPGALHHAAHGPAPIIFTAPHSVRHLRGGAIKRADMRTGGLAELLAIEASGRVLASTGLPADDPNWHDGPTPFRRALLEVLRPGDLVIDLHGMGDEHGVDIVIGLGPLPNAVSLSAAARLEATLAEHGLTSITGHPFPALHSGTVTASVQAAGFSALQMEVAACRRHPLREPALARQLVAALLQWAPVVHDLREPAIF